MNEAEKKFLQKNNIKPKVFGNTYYWITCVHDGKTVICGFRNSEEEAQQYVYDHNLENEKIYKLQTRDINAASRMIRGNKLNESKNIDEAMQRFKRKL